MKLTSPMFADKEQIPWKYTCQGEDINPPLKITGIPEGAKTLALIMDDPDAPNGTWDHWIVWNIKPTDIIEEDDYPGVFGTNSWGRTSYGGPCPPAGTHRYYFKLYALDRELELHPGASKRQLEEAMAGYTIAKAQLMGMYTKK
ncbi:MAG: YbhB/YbcL family Raf kinase inhibitor-like protein [Candidatus Omnitrophica bacterium]|nr:YbhB/YbcL family Raf kinase inhibitor-like protein [Candidatus Omnitrophota bacterium]MCB9720311.1 YbhB/YbcL family Raf kinase inhibitor-like protein [Candidatus Omnitrophota bacterium]